MSDVGSRVECPRNKVVHVLKVNETLTFDSLNCLTYIKSGQRTLYGNICVVDLLLLSVANK